MAERWEAWKTKIRFSTLPTAPWKSRKGGEIPTFPQLRRFVPRAKKTWDNKKCGLWKSGNPKAGFPLSHSPDSRRRKEEDCSNQSLKGTGRAAPTGIISCSSCIGNGSSFHAHPSIGKCFPGVTIFMEKHLPIGAMKKWCRRKRSIRVVMQVRLHRVEQ